MASMLLPRASEAGHSVLLVGNQYGYDVAEYSTSGSYLGNFVSGVAGASEVTVASSGDVYLSNWSGVKVYSPGGTLLIDIATSYQPGQTQVAANGDILVNSYYGGDVYAYSSTGQSLGLFSNPGLKRAYFSTMDSAGNLYITDQFSGVVEKISPTGVDMGAYINHLVGVTGITFDSRGDLFANVIGGGFAPDGKDKIVEYSPTGAFLGIVAEAGLATPTGLAIGPDGNLFVANGGNNTITEYTTRGSYLGVFASAGMNNPIGIAFTNAAVPEPSSTVLLLIGGVSLSGVWTVRRRAGRVGAPRS